MALALVLGGGDDTAGACQRATRGSKNTFSSGRYLPPAAHPLSTALCGSGLVYACVY